ncbi:MAG: hypothetical protein K9J13_06565 [Saprospiraceae bacterium]|nr:hypothetical protein [Saprospiraceae bacterium]
MRTIRLKINDKIYDRFLWLLSQFNKEEVEIIADNQDFIATQKYLKKELDEIKSGEAVFYSQQQLDKRLDQAIGKYENNL